MQNAEVTEKKDVMQAECALGGEHRNARSLLTSAFRLLTFPKLPLAAAGCNG